MLISELFYSVQGEGLLTGVPSVFIRTSGCNLRCRWCDTPYASWKPEGREMAVEAIVENPEIVLRRQLDKVKTEKMNEMKAAGVEYDQRIAELEKLEYPKPGRDL